MAGYAFPLAAGVKFRGGNLVHRVADADDPHPLAWHRMYLAMTSDPTVWTQWVRPQIDAIHGLGANAIRIMADAHIRFGSAPALTLLTQGQWFTILDQIGSYAASKGIWVYWCVTTSLGVDYGDTTLGCDQDDVEAFITEHVAHTSAYSNTLGYDVCQEIANHGTSALPYTAMADFIAAAKAARVRATPVTVSYTATGPTSDSAAELTTSNTTRLAILSAGGEYSDLHCYVKPDDLGEFDDLLNSSAMIIGESGVQASGALINTPTTTQAAMYGQIAALGADARLQGIWQWAIPVQKVAHGDWSMWATMPTTPDYVFADPRTDETTPFQTIPKTVSGSAPSTTPTSTTLQVTWTDFSPGATYTPQYAPTDANGFPTDDWQDGSPTAGLSQTISALDPDTTYAIRVQAVV